MIVVVCAVWRRVMGKTCIYLNSNWPIILENIRFVQKIVLRKD